METTERKLKLKVNPKDNTITIRRIKDSFTREDIIHAYTAGHGDARKGTSHGVGLIEYKTINNL